MPTNNRKPMDTTQKIGIACAVLTLLCAAGICYFGNTAFGVILIAIGIINLWVNITGKNRK